MRQASEVLSDRSLSYLAACRAETQSEHEVYQLKFASVSTADYLVKGQNVLRDSCKYQGLSEVGWWHVWLSLAAPKQNSKTLVAEIM